MVEYWEKYYSRSLARKGKLSSEDCYCSPQQLTDFLSKHQLPLKGDILVVGTGTSDLPVILAKGASVTAVDVSQTAVDWMRQAQPQVCWHHGDATALPASWENRFDCLIDKGLLAHKLADELLTSSPSSGSQSTLLKEYRRVLKTDGFAVVVSLGQLREADISGWMCEKYQLEEAWVHVLQMAALYPTWILGISWSSTKVMVRTKARRAHVDLFVSSENQAHILCICRDAAPHERCLELSLPSSPLQARWTHQGLELLLTSDVQSPGLEPLAAWAIQKGSSGERVVCHMNPSEMLRLPSWAGLCAQLMAAEEAPTPGVPGFMAVRAC